MTALRFSRSLFFAPASVEVVRVLPERVHVNHLLRVVVSFFCHDFK